MLILYSLFQFLFIIIKQIISKNKMIKKYIRIGCAFGILYIERTPVKHIFHVIS